MKILNALILSVALTGCVGTFSSGVSEEVFKKEQHFNRVQLFELSRRACGQETAWCMMAKTKGGTIDPSEKEVNECRRYFIMCVMKAQQSLKLPQKREPAKTETKAK